MKVVPLIVTYNVGASGPCIMRCVDYLMAGVTDSFGTAIEQIDIYPHCQTRDLIIPGLEFMLHRFQERLATLPVIRFRRKARLFEISYASMWIHSDTMFGSSIMDLPPSEFGCLVREFATALSLVRSRVKKSDDYNVDAFEAHLQRRVNGLNQQLAGSRGGESANKAVKPSGGSGGF